MKLLKKYIYETIRFNNLKNRYGAQANIESMQELIYVHWASVEDIISLISDPNYNIELSCCIYDKFPILAPDPFNTDMMSVGVSVKGDIIFAANGDLMSGHFRRNNNINKYPRTSGRTSDQEWWNNIMLSRDDYSYLSKWNEALVGKWSITSLIVPDDNSYLTHNKSTIDSLVEFCKKRNISVVDNNGSHFL